MANRRPIAAGVLRALGALLLVRLAGAGGATALFATVFPVECKARFLLWQTVALWHSYRKVGQPGSFTRLLACAEEEREAFRDAGGMDICPTHVTPSYTNYQPGDSYGPYNMAGTVLHWITHTQSMEEYVLIVDSDMIFLRPMLPSHLGVRPGHAVAAFYGYLQGVAGNLADRHIPEVLTRDDSLAGPPGRRSDQVGGVQAMTNEDLKRVAPLWLEYTKRVREDSLAWADTGDVYVPRGGKPWISEMYGYSFGCAKADVWHSANNTMMIYPSYLPTGVPSIIHYGIAFHIGDVYSFHKHWHPNFDPLKCPAPEPMHPDRPDSGLLPAPPGPSEIPPAESGWPRLQHLYAAVTVAALNEAFCDLHMSRCELTRDLIKMCDLAVQLAQELNAAIRQEEWAATHPIECWDTGPFCEDWALKGQCEENPDYMLQACPATCGLCAEPGSLEEQVDGECEWQVESAFKSTRCS